MKKYVFLTQSISGITGNQRYVNNKCKLLRENGWEVIVLWNLNIAPVELEHVKCFDNKKYIHHELKFYPSWFSERGRNKVLDKLVSVIGDADQIVIESNKLELGAWGELLAQKLHCKHINYVTTEGLSIRNQSTFDYCYAKLLKNEFFNINPSSVIRFFSNFTTIEFPENHFWNASTSSSVDVEEYSFPAFDDLPKADYTITHFGRYKKYIPKLISELNSFTTIHSDKHFNIFFLGNGFQQDVIRDSLEKSNVHVAFHSEVTVIPKQIFEKSDVIVATAGCASLASLYMPNAIAMDVRTMEPLGLHRRTTWDSNASSGRYDNNKSIFQWLDSLLINKESYPLLERPIVPHGFDYQMQFVDQCDYTYFDTTKVKERMTQHDGLYEFLVKMGLSCVVEYFYFKRRGVKTI